MGALAVKGGEPVRSKPWPSWPVWGERELELLREVLESGFRIMDEGREKYIKIQVDVSR